MTSVVNINDVFDGHVGLDLACIDRLYLNAYVPNLQVGGQVVTFLTAHLGFPIPSPALLQKIGNRFRRDVKAFAAEHEIPILHLKKPDRSRFDDRKLDHVRPYLERAEAEGRFGVVAIVATQEFAWVFSAKNRSSTPGVVSFDFVKEDRRVGMYYFYVLDPEFGPGFIKICTYFPYPSRVWVNGHEWAKRQADRAGIAFTELANGFASCDDPAALQAICDRFGPADIQGFFDRWTRVIPTPFTEADRAAGYFWELSMRQVEVSRTWSSTTPAGPGASSSPWSPTTSTSAVPSRSMPSSGGTAGAGPPPNPSAPGCSRLAPRCTSTSPTNTAESSNTSRKGGPCVSRPSSTSRLTSGSWPGSSTCPSWWSKARGVNDRLLMH